MQQLQNKIISDREADLKFKKNKAECMEDFVFVALKSSDRHLGENSFKVE